MSKFLEAIGIHAMTNREALMEELDALDDATFEYMVLSRQSDLPEILESAKCRDCKKEHGGKCPLDDDDDACVLKLNDWLSQPCTHERLLPEVTA